LTALSNDDFWFSFLVFILFFIFEATPRSKDFALGGEYLSFASPKERHQRKGDPMPLEIPLKNADV
jgi:hypothetical protein